MSPEDIGELLRVPIIVGAIITIIFQNGYELLFGGALVMLLLFLK